jgi:hypothetical protein
MTTIKMYPIEFEATDETDEMLFRVRCFDEAVSNVEIKTLVTPESWLEISAKVHEALLAIHKEPQ